MHNYLLPMSHIISINQRDETILKILKMKK